MRRSSLNIQAGLIVLACGELMVLIQHFIAYKQGFFSQKQLHARGITKGGSSEEHGGLWADMFYISPWVAIFVAYFQPRVFWLPSILIFAASCGITYGAVQLWAKQNAAWDTPTAHTRFGKTTVVGWIHAVFMAVALWSFGMFYLCPLEPAVTKIQVVVVTLSLFPFFYLGVKKFRNPPCPLNHNEWKQVGISWAGVSLLAAIKIVIFT